MQIDQTHLASALHDSHVGLDMFCPCSLIIIGWESLYKRPTKAIYHPFFYDFFGDGEAALAADLITA